MANVAHTRPDSPPDDALFRLDSGGIGPDRRNEALAQLSAYLGRQQANFLGYQVNQKLSFSGDLAGYLDIHLNNSGDPWGAGHFTTNTKPVERAVLEYFARLWHGVPPGEAGGSAGDPCWGYVLSMGSSEGNLYALWNARDYLTGKTDFYEWQAGAGPGSDRAGLSPSAAGGRPPVAFYSAETHYSIKKALRVLDIPSFQQIGNELFPGQCPLGPDGRWPDGVPCEGGEDSLGSIDVGALRQVVEFFAARHYPVIVILNYGTTFKGSLDNVKAAGEAILPVLERHGLAERTIPRGGRADLVRTGYWIHVDGALGAGYMPFLEQAWKAGQLAVPDPSIFEFDFRLPFVHSISLSSHKWIGSPFPGGIFMTRRRYQLHPPDISYLGSVDNTFSGSRNGLLPLLIWDYLARMSPAQQIEKALGQLRMAEYAEARLQAAGVEWVERSPLSLAVRFRRPSEALVARYSLACESVAVAGAERPVSHIYAMGHVDEALVDRFVEDLIASR